ncbi:nucleotidyltransferase family protein [Sphingomonas sp.]|uniref:nucleotidyltransferase domain-containing protein n=1 Tax=Sphingomonas sp. TaxID=28214 RepID=UPI002EDB81F2
MGGAIVLARVLADPQAGVSLDGESWNALIATARAERLLGTLAHRMRGVPTPGTVTATLADARAAAEHGRRAALWEAEMARRALAPLGCAVVLLKGTAFVAGGLLAGRGRSIGDLDILVPRGRLDAVEAALLAHGWEWVKPDAYDDAYYRRWMHELPPLIHRERDRMIDVHHTILPPTARPAPDAAALIGGSILLENGLRILSPADMIVHAAAHLIADGDLTGGLRNLWDIDQLCREFEESDPDFCLDVMEQAHVHGLSAEVARALRLAQQLFGTPLTAYDFPMHVRFDAVPSDRIFCRRLLARDGWGRGTRPLTRFAFYMRSHWLRMPPMLLARHLWIKWRRQSASSVPIRSS